MPYIAAAMFASTAYNAYEQNRRAKEAKKTAGGQAAWQRDIAEKYLGMTEEDREREWQRYNEYIKPMESALGGYANKLMGGDVAGGYARTLAEVDPQFEQTGIDIRNRAARTGLSRTNPGALQFLLSRNEMARTGARLRVRGAAEEEGTRLMSSLLSGKGQPQRISPAFGISAGQAGGQFAMQGAGYGVQGGQALGQGAMDLSSMYFLSQYMPKKPGVTNPGMGGTTSATSPGYQIGGKNWWDRSIQ